MNNLKKVGLTALGTVLVAGSAQAAYECVLVSIFFGGEDNSNSGNGWSMTDQVTFSQVVKWTMVSQFQLVFS